LHAPVSKCLHAPVGIKRNGSAGAGSPDALLDKGSATSTG
jgi:hypothetical protein